MPTPGRRQARRHVDQGGRASTRRTPPPRLRWPGPPGPHPEETGSRARKSWRPGAETWTVVQRSWAISSSRPRSRSRGSPGLLRRSRRTRRCCLRRRRGPETSGPGPKQSRRRRERPTAGCSPEQPGAGRGGREGGCDVCPLPAVRTWTGPRWSPGTRPGAVAFRHGHGGGDGRVAAEVHLGARAEVADPIASLAPGQEGGFGVTDLLGDREHLAWAERAPKTTPAGLPPRPASGKAA